MGNSLSLKSESESSSSAPCPDIRSRFNFKGIRDITKHSYCSCICTQKESDSQPVRESKLCHEIISTKLSPIPASLVGISERKNCYEKANEEKFNLSNEIDNQLVTITKIVHIKGQSQEIKDLSLEEFNSSKEYKNSIFTQSPISWLDHDDSQASNQIFNFD